MDQSTDQTVEEELDAAFAALGPTPSYSQAVLEGVTLLRPTVMKGLADLARIPADRLAAATTGQLELDPDEIRRIEEATDLCALELATAKYPPPEEGDGLGALFRNVVDADRERFQAARAAAAAEAAG